MANQEVVERLTHIESILSTLVETTDRPFNLGDAAEYLNLSKSHLYQLTRSGAIGHYKPAGKKIFFDKSDLDEYLRRNRVRPQWEIDAAIVARGSLS